MISLAYLIVETARANVTKHSSLLKSQFGIVMVNSRVHCISACLAEPRCLTVNYETSRHNGSLHHCELNLCSAYGQGNMLQSRDGYDYMELDIDIQ